MRFRGRGTILRALVAVAGLALSACGGAPRAGSGASDMDEPAPPAGPAHQPDAETEDFATLRARAAADTTDAEAWFRLGTAWQEAGRADSAYVAFNRVLEVTPDDVRALVHCGLVLEDLSRPADALARYDRAIEVAPEDPVPWINRGSLLYFREQDFYGAKTAFARALELDPENPEAHFNLGVMFADQSMFREAAVEWEAVIELTEDGPARERAANNLKQIRSLIAPAAKP